jgi:hypothetical protein
LIVTDLCNIGSEVFFGPSINLDYLECCSDTPRTEARNDSIIAIVKANNLILGPEPSKRRGRCRYRIAKYLSKEAFKDVERSPFFRFLRKTLAQLVAR